MQNKLPKGRTAKEATHNEEAATHVVKVYGPGCGTSCDVDFFIAAGVYSDHSGCSIPSGDRDHTFYVVGEGKASEMATRLRACARSLDALNKRDLGITIEIAPKVKRAVSASA